MDFHTANMIDSLQSGDITRFKQDFEQKMNELIVSKIEDKKSLVMQSVQEEEGDEGCIAWSTRKWKNFLL